MSQASLWFRLSRRGSATTEKMLIMLLGVMIIVPAILLFGPIVQAKFAVVVEALGGPAANSISAREARSPSSDIALYVVLFSAMTIFFSIVVVFPLFFRRARIRRQLIINELAERFPFLAPLVDHSEEFERNMRQMKALADEVRDMEPPRATALEVAAPDLGRSASPADVTMSNEMMPKSISMELEETIPGSMISPTALRTTPQAGLPSITPTGGNAAVRATPIERNPVVLQTPIAGTPHIVQSVQEAWAPRPTSPSQDPTRQDPARTPRAFDVPDLGWLVQDEENIATVDVRDPSLLTSLPMSEFRDRIKSPSNADETMLVGALDIEHTLPKAQQKSVRVSDEITVDWGRNPLDD